MTDVVVTVPKWFGLETWIAEGDAAGEPWSGQEWDFYLGGPVPEIQPGERVYVVYGNAVRGYAPLVRLSRSPRGYSLVRRGDAVAVTIPEVVRGFRGFRYRWWEREVERPFPQWRDPLATPIDKAAMYARQREAITHAMAHHRDDLEEIQRMLIEDMGGRSDA